MDVEGIVLSEVRQTKADAVWHHLYVESKDYSQLAKITEKKQPHRYREQTRGRQWGAGSVRAGE